MRNERIVHLITCTRNNDKGLNLSAILQTWFLLVKYFLFDTIWVYQMNMIFDSILWLFPRSLSNYAHYSSLQKVLIKTLLAVVLKGRKLWTGFWPLSDHFLTTFLNLIYTALLCRERNVTNISIDLPIFTISYRRSQVWIVLSKFLKNHVFPFAC